MTPCRQVPSEASAAASHNASSAIGSGEPATATANSPIAEVARLGASAASGAPSSGAITALESAITSEPVEVVLIPSGPDSGAASIAQTGTPVSIVAIVQASAGSPRGRKA